SRGSHPGISVIGRLHEGTDLEAAVADMDAVARALSREYPETNAEAGVVVRSLRERYVGAARPTVLVLAGAVLLVLLVSCANVASLLLVRGQTRTREAAVRVALGAGRARIARTYATECLVLAGLGGLLGAVLSWGGVDAFRTLAADLPRATRVRADGTVLAAAVGVSILAALLVGLVPAVRLSSTDPAVRLRTGTPGGGGGRREGRLRSGLVMAEVALSFVLLAGSALMLRSMVNLLNEDPGLQPRGVLTARVSVPRTRYPENGDRARFYDRVLERVRSLPGVVAAGAGDPLPLSGSSRQWGISGEGLENVGPDGLRADQGMVTPGYFEALGIPLLAGRTFTADDGPDAPAAVIDATMAERLWPGETALGREVTLQGDGPRATVVGVVAHVKHYGVNEEGRVQIYLPHTVRVWSLNVVVRTTGDPVALAPALRRAVAEVDPAVPVSRIRTMEDMFGETIATERLAARVLTAFAGVAVLLALLGLYGVISWSVGRRTREIGIRMALGARGRSVAARITAGGVLLAGGGVLLGLTGAVAATRALSGLLFGVEARDPVTLAAVGT
ncbi:MAG TPA: FtsX-like permease family protein, partial [Longimicrobiales bacterium]|nr:FtsX-like permease family protein [Longimicrobiales bacterium]